MRFVQVVGVSVEGDSVAAANMTSQLECEYIVPWQLLIAGNDADFIMKDGV